MHEFEGLLFSSPLILAQKLEVPKFAEKFETIKNEYKTPKNINDKPNTAPSKRIKEICHAYDKPYHNECPLFDGWIKQLEAIDFTT